MEIRSMRGEVSSDVEEGTSQKHIPWKMLKLVLCGLTSHSFPCFSLALIPLEKSELEACCLSHLNLLLPW